MRNRWVMGLVSLLLITGCTDKDKVPSGILPREEMGNILWDMVQADQYADISVMKDTARINKKIETLKIYDIVLRMHNVSRDQFKQSFQFYKDRPDLTRPMFDSLLARGNRLRTESYSRLSTVPAIKPPAGHIAPLPGNIPAVNPNRRLPVQPLNKGAGKPGGLIPGKWHRNPVMTPPGARE